MSFPFPHVPPESNEETGNDDSKKKPCRACTDFKSWMKIKPTPTVTKPEENSENQTKDNEVTSSTLESRRYRHGRKGRSENNNNGGGSSSSDDNQKGFVYSAKDLDEYQEDTPGGNCPLDRTELGSNTWSFLHTMAAYYPDRPSPETQTEMNSFIHLFSKFFPCEDCAKDFRSDMKTLPPDTTSRSTLSRWFCRMHNVVNVKLGKPEFDCSKVDGRWKDGWGDGSCD